MRLFLAIDLPGSIKDAIASWRDTLGSESKTMVWRWSQAIDLHLTLVFLGEIDPAQLTLVQSVAKQCAETFQGFQVRISGWGGFPDSELARVFWLGIGPAEGTPKVDSMGALNTIVSDLRTGLSKQGISFDARPWQPHITLARSSRPRPIPQTTELPKIDFTVSAITLFESQANRLGQGYKALGVYPLA